MIDWKLIDFISTRVTYADWCEIMAPVLKIYKSNGLAGGKIEKKLSLNQYTEESSLSKRAHVLEGMESFRNPVPS